MGGEKVTQEKGQILDELLVLGVTRIISALEVESQRNNLGNGGQNFGEHLNQFLVIVVPSTSLESSNLCQTLQCYISELGHLQKSFSKSIDNGRLEDIAKRNPVKESKKGLEGSLDQTFLSGAIQYFVAKLEDGWKLCTHRRLQVLRLCRSHLIRRVIENLLR